MATKYINIVGKCAWAHNLFKYDESRWGKRWMVDVYPNEEGLALMKEYGIALQPIKKPLFEGEIGFRFRRDVEKMIKGKTTEFEPPKVLDEEGRPWGNEERIGNGSTVEINVAVYETRGGDGPNGHRLQGMKVLELVPYVAPDADENAPTTPKPVKTGTSPRVKSPW